MSLPALALPHPEPHRDPRRDPLPGPRSSVLRVCPDLTRHRPPTERQPGTPTEPGPLDPGPRTPRPPRSRRGGRAGSPLRCARRGLAGLLRTAAARLTADDRGMSTVEYAIGTLAAAAFAAVLYTVISGDSIVTALTQLVQRALSVTF
ncbi:DUF4244 domain-containing protein [Pseudonocardia yuanmonensis]